MIDVYTYLGDCQVRELLHYVQADEDDDGPFLTDYHTHKVYMYDVLDELAETLMYARSELVEQAVWDEEGRVLEIGGRRYDFRFDHEVMDEELEDAVYIEICYSMGKYFPFKIYTPILYLIEKEA